MRTILVALVVSVGSMAVCARDAGAQSGTAGPAVCVVIDSTRDTLAPGDRTAAILLLETTFRLEGWRVAPDGCARQYTLSHIRLGEHILVTLSGPDESRVGTAAGLGDLPPLYSQMVRSIVSGRPMTGFNVVDRTNVTAAQAATNRVQSERFAYARLGYGGIFGDRTYGRPGLGVGYRIELDSLGVDVSFLNLQTGRNSNGSTGGAFAGSFLKLQALYFLKPSANASGYVGGGVSWGGMSFGDRPGDSRGGTHSTGWHGSGLQGELTAGYELPRASTFRIFVEATGVLPFYKATSETYSFSTTGSTMTVDSRYASSVMVSVGVGWQRGRRGYR